MGFWHIIIGLVMRYSFLGSRGGGFVPMPVFLPDFSNLLTYEISQGATRRGVSVSLSAASVFSLN